MLRKVFLILVLIGGSAHAADRGTADEAKALVTNAIELFESKGKDAFTTISDPAGPFVSKDLYVTVISTKGILVATGGANRVFIGQQVLDTQDEDGKKFVREYFDATEGTNKEAWVTYKFVDPYTKKVAHKKAFVRRFGDFVATCGIYEN